MTQTYLVYREPKIRFRQSLRVQCVHVEANSLAHAYRIARPLLPNTLGEYITGLRGGLVQPEKTFYI